MSVRLVYFGLLCGFGLGLTGCGGSDLAKVTGKVSYNGQPVAGATVTFMPASGALATGTTDADGQFTLSTVEGEHKVFITKVTGGAANAENLTPDDMKKMQTGDSAASTPKSEIPVKYNSPDMSELTRTVGSSASENQFEFELTD